MQLLTTPLFQVFRGVHINYYVNPQLQGVFDASRLGPTAGGIGDILPLLLFPSNLSLNNDSLSNFISELRAHDDVFSDDFLTGVIAIQGLTSATSILSVNPLANDRSIPPGPYFRVGGSLLQAWRIYPDKLNAFMTPVVPNPTDPAKFQPFSSLDLSGENRGVAVPSRFYHQISKEHPLAGKRIAFKDNIKLAGVKTTQNNKAFAELYEPERESAQFAQRLIDLGAIVVGKTQLSAFASAEEPTDHCVDYHAPWNPRGDGYQTPAGSSHGAAAALAGYEWLDLSFGTDTTGSVRYPAAITGVYGMRHTLGVQSMEGIYPHCREFDAVGSLARSLDSHEEITRIIVGDKVKDFAEFPKSILYPTDFFPYTEAPMQEVLETYVVALEKFLGVKRVEISLAEKWDQSRPAEANGEGLKDYINLAGFHRSFYMFWHAYAKFRDDYKKKFDKNVYVGPYMRWRWGEGEKITLDEHEEAEKRLTVFRRWFQENIIKQDDKTASNAVMLLPVSCYAPDYRDTVHSAPKIPGSFSEAYLPSIMGLPQLVVPIGQTSYESRVSGNTEYHPVTAGIVGAPGSDLMLIKLTKAALAKAGLPTEVKTGRYTFELGKSVGNVVLEKPAL